jgi:hypothetical protein
MWWLKASRWICSGSGFHPHLLLDGHIPVANVFDSREPVFAKAAGFYQEHKETPTADGRGSLESGVVSRVFDWRSALVIVKPDTLIGWHRKGFQRFWGCKSRPGRPSLQGEIRELMVRMAKENPTWGQRRVAAELYLKLRLLVSPRTVRKYWPRRREDDRGKGLRRSAGQPSYATTPMRLWLVISRLQSRLSSSCFPCLSSSSSGYETPYRFVIHDRDCIFSTDVDQELVQGFGVNENSATIAEGECIL